MADDNFTKWHIAGLHALRSASEQGDAAGKALAGKVSNADLKALLGEYSETAGKQETHFVGFLKELGTEPNGFKDRIMEGVGNGTSEMVKARPIRACSISAPSPARSPAWTTMRVPSKGRGPLPGSSATRTKRTASWP
nr:hypothetical protein [Methylorubrum zatmanii]